jgi:F-type H+-transporting ATPase subunit b
VQLELLGLPFQEGEVHEEEQQAPNPIIPAWNEVIWGSLAFLILFVAIAKWGFPAIKKAMDARSDKIQGDIDAAERARSEAEQVKSDLEAQLADARAQANRIIDEARQQAEALKAERVATLDAELAERRQAAMGDIEAAKAQAMADLQGQITDIAIGAAERVVQANLDPATNAQIVERYIAEVGATS